MADLFDRLAHLLATAHREAEHFEVVLRDEQELAGVKAGLEKRGWKVERIGVSLRLSVTSQRELR
jgi:hypothetical protein